MSDVIVSCRMTEKVTQVGPYKVPPGTIVFPCLYSVLMYSGNWDDPHKFDPDRWLKDPNYATDPATGVPRFVPFGIGPKACVAQHLAMVQCKVGGQGWLHMELLHDCLCHGSGRTSVVSNGRLMPVA